MFRKCSIAAPLCVVILILVSAPHAANAAERRVPLLNIAGEQLPNDTALDDKTKLSIEENAMLGGKALKVVYAPGDAFGNKGVGPSNWKGFISVEFTAFNPKSQPANLTFSVRHKRTTSFQTRVDVPVKLLPGKSTVRMGIDEMQNVNGSSPDLSSVTHWYLSCDDSAPTLYFGDFWLVGDDKPATTASGAVGGEVRLAGTYKIRGTIDGKPVDLSLTPDAATAAIAAPAQAAGSRRKISTRRLRARPASVLFSATGSRSPRPAVWTCEAGTPRSTR